MNVRSASCWAVCRCASSGFQRARLVVALVGCSVIITGVAFGQTMTAIQLDHTTSTSGSRCNFGFAEVGGADVVVRVTARDGATGSVLGSKDYGVNANTLLQTSAADLIGAGISAENFYIQYVVVSGAGRILAYAVVADNSSGDAIYVPAE